MRVESRNKIKILNFINLNQKKKTCILFSTIISLNSLIFFLSREGYKEKERMLFILVKYLYTMGVILYILGDGDLLNSVLLI